MRLPLGTTYRLSHHSLPLFQVNKEREEREAAEAAKAAALAAAGGGPFERGDGSTSEKRRRRPDGDPGE